MTRDQFIYALTACGCLLKDGKTWYEHNELIKCFEDMGLFEQEPQKFKWCTDCKEYDQEKHCCHRWSKVIRDTVEEMKQETFINKPCISSGVCEHDKNRVLDKIYADIQKLRGCSCSCSDGIIDDIEDILDKYKAESEE